MQSANYLRGQITVAKGNVAKWTKIEDVHRKNLKPEAADGAKKCLDKAMVKLNGLRAKFESLQFPDSNIFVLPKRSAQCEGCGARIAEGNSYCGECLCEDLNKLTP